jgi:hypothetical protein
MKTNLHVLMLALSTLFISNENQAQASLSTLTTNSAGSHFEGDNIHIEWSIGEMAAVNTSFTGAVIVSKGVLQPQRARRQVNNTPGDLRVYPTITAEQFIVLAGTLEKASSIAVRIINGGGQLLRETNYNNQSQTLNQQIELPGSLRGAAFVEVIITPDDKTETIKKIFRIQKF